MPRSMNAVDPAACRETLGKLLADEVDLLSRMEAQLQLEHQMLADNDVDGLEAAGKLRQDCVARLLRLEDERRALCRALDYPTDLAGVEKLVLWCDPQRSLLPALQECATRATRCREQNDRNGVLVGARLKRVAGMLGMLNPKGRDAQVYGPAGAGLSASSHIGSRIAARA
ncbi:MAG: flagellar protein FlgN [Pseudomonadota bacterium]